MVFIHGEMREEPRLVSLVMSPIAVSSSYTDFRKTKQDGLELEVEVAQAQHQLPHHEGRLMGLGSQLCKRRLYH